MRDQLSQELKDLRDTIVSGFESLETNGSFQKTSWPYKKGNGGGEMSVLRGDIFEKAAVNWSALSGDRLPSAADSDEPTPFFATGVSVITHMTNPKAPTSHLNVRYIETNNSWWLGGGFDLTPMGFVFEEDTEHFHAVARKALAPFGENLYEEFSKKAREYFWIPHRQRQRGIGGIFFDHYNTGDPENDVNMWRSVGQHFLEAVIPIYKTRIRADYNIEDRATQLTFRGHYVEFNLLYDRGTRFGFQSGGNPEAILCSMPPLAGW